MTIDNILGHLERLVACDTQNPPRRISKDSDIFTYLTDCLSDLFEINCWDHGDGHVSWMASRGDPTVLFNVHLDTVPAGQGWQSDPLQLKRGQDRVFGRGVCDIKGAAACLLSIAGQAPDNMAVLFTTDEEGAGGCCVERFLEAGEADGFKQVVVAEPTGCEAVLAHRGFLSFKAWFSGVAGHSSEARSLRDNAIHQFSHWAAAVLELAETGKQSDDDPGTCLNIGLVEGGTKSNVIAGEVFGHASARLQPGQSNEAFARALQECAPPWARPRWEIPFMGEPLPAHSQDAHASEEFAAENELVVGKPVDFWTEASIFSKYGLPALVLGPGSIEQAHVANEWVSLDQLSQACRLYQQIISRDKGGPSLHRAVQAS